MKKMIHIRKKYWTLFLCFVVALFCLTACFSLAQKRERNGEHNLYPIDEFPPSVTQAKQEKTNEEPNQTTSYKPLNYEKIKGVWISYIEYGWALTGKTEEQFRTNISSMFDTLESQGLNTAIAQVRSHGDAYYESDYYPWSLYASGTVGQNPEYDPLAIMIEEAHKRNISVHAWINPYRLMKDEQMSAISDDYAIKQWYQNTEYMQQYQGYWYLNPQQEQVQKLICDGVSELVQNYSLDGIQIDDYFYVVPPSSFGTDEAQAKKNTTAMVQSIYKTIKSVNQEILFGVSPAGNYTDVPRSDATQYTDLTTWCTEEGYLDYVAPQIYWAFDDETAPFKEVLNKWSELCKDSPVKLCVGLAAYKFPKSEMLEKQVEETIQDPIEGYIYFRYDNIV